MFLNRIPTRGNLLLRNALPPETSTLCVMCSGIEESTLHLFLHCEVASLVWLKLMLWIDCFFLIPHNLFVHWECWSQGGSNKKVRKGLGLICLTTVWVLWKAKNDKIFKVHIFEVDNLVEEVKVLSWKWLLSMTHTPPCLFFKWCWNPILCLAR